MHTSLFSLCSYVAVLTSYGKEGKKIRHYCLSLKMVFVFHAVKSLIDSICMDLQSTKVIFFAFWSASMGDYNSNRIIMIENTMNKIKKMIAVSSHLLVWRWQNVFSSSSNAGLFTFYLRIQGCRPTHPPSQHPALIHFQQILHRLTCSRTSWGFVTVPGWELIRWTPRGVCIFKPKRRRLKNFICLTDGGVIDHPGTTQPTKQGTIWLLIK